MKKSKTPPMEYLIDKLAEAIKYKTKNPITKLRLVWDFVSTKIEFGSIIFSFVIKRNLITLQR